MSKTILRIDSSMRHDGSVSRRLTDSMIERLRSEDPGLTVIERDLAEGLPAVNPDFIAAKGSDERDPAHNPVLAKALELIEELRAADEIVIGAPVYNFTAPGELKRWVDLVALPGETFRYSAKGPEGLLRDRPVHVLVASGGTELGSDIDFLTPWLRHVLGFLGLHDVRFIAADRLAFDADASIEAAEQEIRQAA